MYPHYGVIFITTTTAAIALGSEFGDRLLCTIRASSWGKSVNVTDEKLLSTVIPGGDTKAVDSLNPDLLDNSVQHQAEQAILGALETKNWAIADLILEDNIRPFSLPSLHAALRGLAFSNQIFVFHKPKVGASVGLK